MNRLKAMLDVLFRSADAHARHVRDLVEPLRPLYDERDDEDLAWFVSRVTFAVGPAPAFARRPIDLDEVKKRVQDALGLVAVKNRTYYCIGDPAWTLYAPAFVLPLPEEDALAMLPKLPDEEAYRVVIVDGDMVLFRGDARVDWPEFNPPLLRQLLADDSASGFVRAELAVKGNMTLPPAVSFKPFT